MSTHSYNNKLYSFSIVVEEVRKLAEETSNSSNQISDLILNIQKQIEDAVMSMKMNTEKVDDGKGVY